MLMVISRLKVGKNYSNHSGDMSTKEENERQYRIIDQMLTMHSSLRDRMERRAFWLNTILIATSIFLAVFIFVGDDLIILLGLDPTITRFILGLFSIIILVGAITEFRVDWRSVAGKHDYAASRLGELKLKYRKSFAETLGNDNSKNEELVIEYEKVMGSIPKIPDKWFNTLKAEHNFKIILSKKISYFSKAPVWFLRLKLRLEGIREAFKSSPGN